MIKEIENSYAPGEYLLIRSIDRYNEDDKVRVEFTLDNGLNTEFLWYRLDKEFEPYICDDRCDTAMASLLLSSMKKGYKVIASDYPISEKLYYNLKYHVVPQLYSAGGGTRTSNIEIKAPITRECFKGEIVATGMSRGVDSFATMVEYSDFELKDYELNAFTYFKIGAHHGFDSVMGRGKETKDELFLHQMEGTVEFCKKYNYPLIVVESNISAIIAQNDMFPVGRFDQTHTLRNLGVVILLQKGIKRYYYSSTYNLDEFKVDVRKDMAYYEKWIIPHLSTGSVEFYQANQNWKRIDKIQRLVDFEPCYDYLQVCLIQTGNCGECMKCKRTLMELDAFGDDVLERFRNSFDVDRYRREFREEWFKNIMDYKEAAGDPEAHYFEETFMAAAEHHPELLGDMIQYKEEGVEEIVSLMNNVLIRPYPSVRAVTLKILKKGDTIKYLGEWGPWIAVELENGDKGFLKKKFVEYKK